MASLDKAPIEMDIVPANSSDAPSALRTFDSYAFDRNLLTPASPFRFTAPGVDKSARLAIRSGDTVSLFGVNSSGKKLPIGTGFIDETDTHITPQNVEYVLTGRDTIGQLVDNTAVDDKSRIINTKSLFINNILDAVIANTRIPKGTLLQNIPNGQFLFQTNPGETKINSLQRYLEFTNCLIWSMPDGRIKLGKPDFTQTRSGSLILNTSSPVGNNVLEARVRRNLNQAIRQIVTQLQTLDQVFAGSYTLLNSDPDLVLVAGAGVGRSVYQRFAYGNGNDSVNTIIGIGNGTGSPRTIGTELSLREIAKENMKILDVEAVLQGHMNDDDVPYNVDQVYNVQIEDEDVSEDMLVYGASYELTKDHGILTRLRLCKLGTIVAYANALAQKIPVGTTIG